MDRVQLFEFEDLPWFPRVVRECMTDFLSFLGQHSKNMYAGFAERLASAMAITGDDTLIDLCSGGGGPALAISELLRAHRGSAPRLVLTDLYPNLPRLQRARRDGSGLVEFCEQPVDATRVPSPLRGFRLICNAFHHFAPASARRCLCDAMTQSQGIAIVELVDRSVTSLLGVTLGTSTLLAFTPFIRPWRISRLILTYLVPVVPLCTWWDGVVSCLRAYRPRDLEALVAALPDHGYKWEIGRLRVPGAPTNMIYLIGYPAGVTAEHR